MSRSVLASLSASAAQKSTHMGNTPTPVGHTRGASSTTRPGRGAAGTPVTATKVYPAGGGGNDAQRVLAAGVGARRQALAGGQESDDDWDD